MRTRRPKSALSINEEERAQLLSIVRPRSLPSALTQRAASSWRASRDPSNKAVAADLGVGAHTVGKWRNRFITHRLEGLRDHLT
jgi:putative transposase